MRILTPVEPKRCLWCRGPILTRYEGHSKHKYCSGDCRQKFNNAKHHAIQKAEESVGSGEFELVLRNTHRIENGLINPSM